MNNPKLKEVIEPVMRAEGWDKYTNNPLDKGGPTRWGITQATARAFGYMGDMRVLPYETAFDIYVQRFWSGPKFDMVAAASPELAYVMFDWGVNSGPSRPARALQRSLNALNRQGKDYPDIDDDGALGNLTLGALDHFMSVRGKTGLFYLNNMIKAQRSVFLLEISERTPSQETFQNGWQERVFK